MLVVHSLYILAQLVLSQLSAAETYKEVFKVRSGLYRSFYTVDYKFIDLPPNLYSLNVSFKLMRWIGFVPLCPSSINITSVFQAGTFPLFDYDRKFRYNTGGGGGQHQRIDMFIAKAEKWTNTRAFKLPSPRAGTWVFGSIYEINDRYQHHVMCLADLQVTFTGFVAQPSMRHHLPVTRTSLTFPVRFDKPGGRLIEIQAQAPLNGLRVVHLCRTCSIAVSSGVDVVPQIPSFTSARDIGLLYPYNRTIVSLFQVHLSTRLLLYVQSFSHSVSDVTIHIEYSPVRQNIDAILLPPLMKIRGDTLFAYKFTLPDSDGSKIPLTLELGKVVMAPFFIDPIKDQGSTLSVDISVFDSESVNASIYVCIAGFALCRPSELISAVTNGSVCRHSGYTFPASPARSPGPAKFSFQFRYPEWSWWYISILAEPPSRDANYSGLKANLSVFSKSCLKDSSLCNGRGVCLLTGVDTGLVSSCHCFKPFFGLDCLAIYKPLISKVKDSTSRRDWLVFSNMAFIPAIVSAAVQKLFVLVVIYLATAVFSMVYHMCYMDDSDLAYCALKVEKLAYYDHLAAVISIWMTMVSLTTLPCKIQMILNVIMIFVCVVLADIIQKSIWFYVLPISIGLVILIVCWVYRMRQLKCIFPPLDWWVFGLFPGLIIAGIGFMMFRLSVKREYEYYFYHSIWHIFIALCICFVLPNTKRWTKALNQTTSDGNNFQHLYNLLTINNQKWYKFKKDLNYYIHLDVLLNPLLERNSKWSICKSY